MENVKNCEKLHPIHFPFKHATFCQILLKCEVIAIDKLAGGTADDYCEQVTICWL